AGVWAVEFAALVVGGFGEHRKSPGMASGGCCVADDGQLGVGSSDEEKDVTVVRALRQVFGNAYLMEEERAELYTLESNFRCGRITAKEFVRGLAKSDTYKKRFFENVSHNRFIELTHMHLLGRACLDKAEFAMHANTYAAAGYDADIDSYIDSEEYAQVFGEDVVPFVRFRGTYAPINAFNRMCTLEGGWASSDKSSPLASSVGPLLGNTPTSAFSVADGLPPIPNAEHPSAKYDLPQASLQRYRNELDLAKAKALELSLALEESKANLKSSQSFLSPFKNMVADMDLTPLYGKPFGNGSVEAFSGQYKAPGGATGEWGVSGVEASKGRTRRAAADVGEKEKRLESLTQLITDLERKVALLSSEITARSLSPVVDMDSLEAAIAVANSAASASAAMSSAAVRVGTGVVRPAVKAAEEAVEDEEDDEDLEDEVFVPKPVTVITSRSLVDLDTPTPGQLMKEMEEARKAGVAAGTIAAFGGPADAKLRYPGDGSEMNVS
ncbi:hypothetical protein MMPV_010104, partial [Pyropia vietnamensis]